MCLFPLRYHKVFDIYILLQLWVLWSESSIFNTALAKKREMLAKTSMQIDSVHPSRIDSVHPSRSLLQDR